MSTGKVLTGVVIATVVALAVAAFWLTSQGGPTAPAGPEPAASQASTPVTVPSDPAEAPPPTGAEIADLGSALRSADAASISRYVPLAPGEELEADFPAQLARMDLSIRLESLRELEPGVWQVTAVDGSSETWSVGLVRRGEQLIMFSAEKEGAE